VDVKSALPDWVGTCCYPSFSAAPRSHTADRRPSHPSLWTNPCLSKGPSNFTLTLGGERLDLVRNAANTAWVARRNGAQLEVRARGEGSMVMYDGEGWTYNFSARGPRADAQLIGGNFYLLSSIIGSDSNSVDCEYGLSAPALPSGDTGLAINLSRVRYNKSPTTAGCYKNSVSLKYDAPATSPLAITMLGGTPLVRVQKVFQILVFSRANCTTPPVVLRRYNLNYQLDLDTELPRLQSVTMNGQQGTPEGKDVLLRSRRIPTAQS
jgi:hypothetical protein